ncbi:MAG: aminomethyl-transferring glycine dehydrogenase [Bacteroidia bacterium]
MGPDAQAVAQMLDVIGVSSLAELIAQSVPARIRMDRPLPHREPMHEYDYLHHLREVAARNRIFKTYIGQGYYDCITPPVIQRNIFENPGWYTQYTPYQAEIAQGRLEALLNFQTMVVDMTGLPVANASLLDEGTAAAEAMSMAYAQKYKKARQGASAVLLVADTCLPQTIDVLRTRAGSVGIEMRVSPPSDFRITDEVFAAIVQYPDKHGAIADYRALADALHAQGSFLLVAADLLALTLLEAPASFGADVVFGSSQRLGIPMGYGGPHAAFFAAQEAFTRLMPGRIIGVSVDRHGRPALRMALQTREQHIRRDKATSNICTAQALLAIMAGMYAVWHGPAGLKAIAQRIHDLTRLLHDRLASMRVQSLNQTFFDTLSFDLGSEQAVERLRAYAEERRINLRYEAGDIVGISLDETTSLADVEALIHLFTAWQGLSAAPARLDPARLETLPAAVPAALQRRSPFLTHPVFNSHHSETAMMRYIARLESRDLSLNTAMIPLGSCTMKLNAATELMPLSWPEFAKIHPFVPTDQAQGYRQIITDLGRMLCEVTGFDGVSFQPNSGAQGEYTGLMVIRAWHESRGQSHRHVALIPDSAHGTNPASAVMAGMKVVVVRTDERGNIDEQDLREKAEAHSAELACLMITYPSTFGVFEEGVRDICALIHERGGQVYMDGANMNAQVGLTSPGFLGADVCHLNLHKTFAIPHGGGGPGMGPICVARHLTPFLPGHVLVQTGGNKAIPAVAATPFGSASILLISYAYLKLLGSEGARLATEYAILNANYLKSRLEAHYPVVFQGETGRVAHEFILDLRAFKRAGVEVDDITKRLIDYGFHAPTVSWPVPGTIMIEPTESEPKAELDRFCEAMIAIREEIREVELGLADPQDNVLHHAPHTMQYLMRSDWKHAYTREKAAYPIPVLREHKFWASVGRVDNVQGDRNLVCTCLPLEAYAAESV